MPRFFYKLPHLNVWPLNLRAVVLLTVILFSCQEKENKDRTQQNYSSFRNFEKSLNDCKVSSIDSTLLCVQSKSAHLPLSSDTMQASLWKNYGIAKTLIQNGFILKALPYINQALPLTEGYSYRLEQAKLFDLRGAINANANNALAAASDLYQASDLFVVLDQYPEAASCYLSLSNLQYNSGNYDLAIEDGDKAIHFFKQSKQHSRSDSSQLINALNTLGLANFHLERLDSATKYFKLANQYAVALNNELWIGLVTGNSAKIDIQNGQTKIAVEKLQQKLAACLKHNEFAAAGSALITMAEVEMTADRPDKAKQFYDSAWSLMKQEKRQRIWIAYYQSVSTWYERMGHYQEAHDYSKKYMTLRDSIQGGNPISAQLLQVQSNNQFKKQLADFSLLKAENEVKNQELKVWQISIIAIIIISILLAILLNTINKNYKKLNELNGQLENKVRIRTVELMKINKELDTYLYRSSHDVRRPILSIIGLTQLTNLVKGEEELREIQLKIEDTARTMDKMLRKLQMAYELDKLTDMETIEVSDHIKNLAFSMQQQYPRIAFDFKSNVHGLVQSNAKLLDIIFDNILENACIFSTSIRPKVGIEIQSKNETIIVRITDNGIGIDKKYWTEMFKPYTRFSERSVGSGLGLHLVEKSLRKINGSVQVQSTLYKGSEFIVSMPAHEVVEMI